MVSSHCRENMNFGFNEHMQGCLLRVWAALVSTHEQSLASPEQSRDVNICLER